MESAESADIAERTEGSSRIRGVIQTCVLGSFKNCVISKYVLHG